MSDLEKAFGNINDPGQDAMIREIHTDPPRYPPCVWYGFYMEAPQIVDWLIEYGVPAKYEQRKNEGVTILIHPENNKLSRRAEVGNYIVINNGHPSVLIYGGK